MKTLKIVAYALAAIVIVLIGLVVFVVATFDPNNFKTEITAFVQEKKGRTLAIDGDIALSLWPNIGVRLGKTSLSEHKSATQFAAVESARVSLALMPLLKKELVINHLEIDGVHARLVRHKDGSLNIADLLSEDKEESEAMRFDISGITLHQAQLSWLDEQNGESIELSRLEIATGRIGNSASDHLQLSANLSSANPHADLGIKFDGRYEYDLARKNYAITKLKAQLSGKALALSDIDIDFSADELRWQQETQKLLAKSFAVKGKTKQDGNEIELDFNLPALSLGGEKSEAEGQDAVLKANLSGPQRKLASTLKIGKVRGTPQNIRIEALDLQAKGKEGVDNLDLALNFPALSFANDRIESEGGNLRASLDGKEHKANLALSLSRLRASMEGINIAKLTLEASAEAASAVVKAKFETPLDFDLKGLILNLSKFTGNWELTHPQLPMKTLSAPASGSLKLDLSKQGAAGAIDTRFDESRIQGQWNVSRFSPLAFGFDFDIDRLNVDKYLPQTEKTAQSAAKVQTDPPVDLSALKGWNVNGKLSVGALQVSGVKMSTLKTQIQAANDKLDITPHSAQLYDGSVTGSLHVDAAQNLVTLKESATNIQIGPLLRDLLQQDILEGRGTLEADLGMRGQTVGAMKKSLNGTSKLALRDGAIKGIDLAKSFRTLKAQFRGEDAMINASQAQKTDFSALTASFVVRDGVAKNDDLSAQSPFFRITGAGEINIGASTMDYLSKVTVVNTSGGQDGKDLESLKGLTIPVRLVGPFDKLSYRIEFGKLLQEQAKAKVEEKKEEVKQKAQEKVQDSIKGLLKKK
ncbi:MAG: AsmA family protein [Betaproteobacteria bacterium]|nr:AsmA family protein [Betaproteobacteria bacterium]